MTKPVLFALNASQAFGQRVANHLGLNLAVHEERTFEDGEHKIRPLESVRQRRVYILSSLHTDVHLSVNDKLSRLLMFIGALKDASAREITLVLPYLAYARKDRRTKPRDPLSLRYLAAMLEVLGTDRIVALEVHNPAAFQNAFRCINEHLGSALLLTQYFAPKLKDTHDIVIISPDTGGYKRAHEFRLRLEQHLQRAVGSAFVEKIRSSGKLFHGRLVGEVQGATAIIVDDMIVTGSTLLYAARTCKAQGAERVIATAAHGLFNEAANESLGDPVLDQIVICDSVPPWRLHNARVTNKLEILDTSAFFAQVIRRIHAGESLTQLMNY